MNDKPTRRPKPYAPPLTLAELVLDLEQRMEVLHGADALTDVELPAEDWALLVEAAEEEFADDRLAADTAAQIMAKLDDSRDLDAAAQFMAKIDSAVKKRDLKAQLADALGWGALNSDEDLLQVVRGLVMALDVERS